MNVPVFHALRRHPFPVEAFFGHSLVLTYALRPAVLQPLLGPGLELDCYEGSAFLAIAIVQTRNLRPKGFPAWLGRDFFLSGYRIFARFSRPGKQSLRGLRILRSDTDRASMARLGNVFTHYAYRLAEVDFQVRDSQLEVRVRTPEREADLHATADLNSMPASLPLGSPFKSMADACRFAGPLPYTFSYDEPAGKMAVIRGLRQAWDPQPVQVTVHQATYFEHPCFAGADVKLANAFYVKDVPYAWKAGTLEALA